MTPRAEQVKGLRERRAAETRAEIVQAGIGLFVAQGFDATSMSDVAAAAGVSRRTVYRYFATKDDIVFEAPRRWLEVFDDVLEDRGEHESTRDVFRRALVSVAEFVRDDADAVLAAYSVLVGSESLATRHGRSDAEWVQRYLEVLGPDVAGMEHGMQQAPQALPDHPHRRRLQLRLSQRQLAHHIGVTAPTLARIEDGSNHAELALETVHRLAGALALDIEHPHARPVAEETHDREDDVARVGAALQQEQGLTSLEALAAAFGWTLERTRAAVDQLAKDAPRVGLRVHELKHEVSLVPAGDPTGQQQMEALARSRYARKELNLTEARVVADIIRGADRRQLQGNAQQVALGRLRNAGYVTADETPCLADDLVYSLLLDKDQP